jgi:phage-related protein
MPAINVLFFRSGSEVPTLDWLLSQSQDAQERCAAAIALLGQQGHEARRPLAENLGEGLYELRAHVGRVQYRFLYFFDGQTAVVLTHGFTKERKIPTAEVKRAQAMRNAYEADPANHHAGL